MQSERDLKEYAGFTNQAMRVECDGTWESAIKLLEQLP